MVTVRKYVEGRERGRGRGREREEGGKEGGVEERGGDREMKYKVMGERGR